MSYKYFVYFNFSGGGRRAAESGTDRTVAESSRPVANSEDLDALEESIAESLGYKKVQIVNLSQLAD